MPIFFVLSGFPAVRSVGQGRRNGAPVTVGTPLRVAPGAPHHARLRHHRAGAFVIYHFRTAGPNPGHSWAGLLRNLTLTQAYTDNYLYSYLHQGLTQMWSLAVEVAFYVALPLLAYLLLVVLCRRRLEARSAVGRPGGAGGAHAGVAGPRAHHRLPRGRCAAVAADVPRVVRGGHDPGGPAAAGGAVYGLVCIPLALVCYFIASTPIAGEPTTSPNELRAALAKSAFYALIAALAVAPLALGDRGGLYARFLASRPMVFLGEISYEIFLIHLITMELVMVEIVRYPIYTGSMVMLFFVTLVVTVPLAWLLHRLTRVRPD